MQGNPVKQRLAAGGLAFGTMLFEFASPGIARIVAGTGAEFLILDMEHSGWGFETVKQQIAAARAAGMVAVVNPPSGAFENVGRCLDLGAQGLLIPVVETREQAEALVAATRYPPHGRRGSAFGVAHDDYAVGDPAATMARANGSTLLMVKIETAKGVANADEILGVPGIDVGFVGHTDLSVSLGIPGQFDRPEFIAARDAVVRACRKHGKAAGCSSPSVAAGIAWIEAGFRLVTYSGDIWIFAEAMRAGLDALKAARPE
ncbi:MAG: HpcH/HpaI aldolase/citrate lyase family protein [Geminicoccaceae bacterium]